MANTRRRRGALKYTKWYDKHTKMLEAIDERDGRDPQIMSFKFRELNDDWFDAYGYAARELIRPYPSFEDIATKNEALQAEEEREREKLAQLAELETAIRNRLTENERRVLELRYNNENIGGALVLDYFSIRGNVMKPGQHLSADEVHNIEPINRRALQAAGYLEIYARGESAWRPSRPRGATSRGRPSLKHSGGATYEAIAKELGLSNASAARKIEHRAVKKLQKFIRAR